MKTIIINIDRHRFQASFYLSPFKRYRVYFERPVGYKLPRAVFISFWHFVIVLGVRP